MGTVNAPVPVTGLAANFSPMPRMAPPPLGKLICGGVKEDGSGEDAFAGDGSELELLLPGTGDVSDIG